MRRLRFLAPFWGMLLAGTAPAGGPTQGVRLPFPPASLGDDASGMEINPAGIALMRGGELQLLGTSLGCGADHCSGGSGVAFFAAKPLFAGLAVGLGLESISTQLF